MDHLLSMYALNLPNGQWLPEVVGLLTLTLIIPKDSKVKGGGALNRSKSRYDRRANHLKLNFTFFGLSHLLYFRLF